MLVLLEANWTNQFKTNLRVFLSDKTNGMDAFPYTIWRSISQKLFSFNSQNACLIKHVC